MKEQNKIERSLRGNAHLIAIQRGITESEYLKELDSRFSTATAQPVNAPKQTKEQALAKFLDKDLDAISETTYDENTFDAAGGEYLVLTDEEADQRAADYIKDSLWAFNPSFLADFTGLPEEMFKAVQGKYEDSNEAILKCIEQVKDQSMVNGLDLFVEQAISADGRGNFLNTYDGEENEEGEYFIYRIN